MTRSAFSLTGATLSLLLTLPAPAFATLGGTSSTVETDRIRMQGALVNIVRTDGYTLHEMRSASGTSIREYVSPSGTVFAVTWDGPWMPDLRQVLGTYFDRYQKRGGGRRTRGVVRIDEPALVVYVSGHQRAFTGRAYAPPLAPPGFRPETLR
jgi:hypothetical protein